ncbi:MAG: hypothetical protein CVU41_12635 [Chloroflexi bacterium HGW-Chloroflexi-3]|nr:MAG: hypothetical protein CVU41_12635 [Chloroflexi bacterium HGW-Chloroflexi-3]
MWRKVLSLKPKGERNFVGEMDFPCPGGCGRHSYGRVLYGGVLYGRVLYGRVPNPPVQGTPLRVTQKRKEKNHGEMEIVIGLAEVLGGVGWVGFPGDQAF